jgi:phage tail protein X
MSSRYNKNSIKKLPDGRRVYRTKIYKNIPKSDKDIYIVTQTGDRLDTLAYDFYGDSSLWWIIATANNIHDATFAVPDGTTLRVPENFREILNNI